MGKPKKRSKKKCAEIEEFLQNSFSLYFCDYDCYFYTFDDDDYPVHLPLFKEGKVNEKILARAAEILGIEPEDILTCNKDAVWKWYKKFPFFSLFREFLIARHNSYFEKLTAEEMLILAIFSDDDPIKPPKRYDEEAIQTRMVEQLKETNAYFPGAYHEGAAVCNFSYNAEHFFSFPKLEEMMRSFFELVSRVRELFFKAWQEPLDVSEVKEYNFLVTALDLVDNIRPHSVYYENLQKLIPIYQQEGFQGKEQEFLQIVHIKFCAHFSPWNCREFCENRDWAQAYADIYPDIKRKMFEFGESVKYFHCMFRWSDDIPPEPDPDLDLDEEEMNGLFDMESFQKELEEELAQDLLFEKIGVKSAGGWTEVRVPKTAEELNGDEVYVEKLIRLGGVCSKGGVKIHPRRRYVGQEEIDRMMARRNVWGNENYE